MGKLGYLIREGFRNLWRHKLTAITAIGSVFLSLLIVGVFFIVKQNSHQLIEYLRSKYKIEVFLLEEIDAMRATEIVETIKDLDKVNSVTLISKSDALKIYEDQFGENLLDILGYNPLPYSAVINIERVGEEEVNVEPLINTIDIIYGVDEVVYQGALIQKIESFYSTSIKILTIIAIGFIFITILIISNAIKLSVYAKENLIQNLQAVGATRRFIRTPFVVEGILEGLIGALLAFGILFGLTYGNNIYFPDLFSIQIDFELFTIVWFIVIAVIISILGSMKGTRKMLG